MKYTEEHEWLRAEGDVVVVGVTDYAAEQMGDVVFVELPDPGTGLSKGDEAVVIESVKVASEVLAPLDGEITEVNTALSDTPDLINASPTGDGWILKMKLKDPTAMDGLMDEAAYQALIS